MALGGSRNAWPSQRGNDMGCTTRWIVSRREQCIDRGEQHCVCTSESVVVSHADRRCFISRTPAQT